MMTGEPGEDLSLPDSPRCGQKLKGPSSRLYSLPVGLWGLRCPISHYSSMQRWEEAWPLLLKFQKETVYS